jgi:FkbH-like protein
MFGFDFSENKKESDKPVINYNGSFIENITHIAPLMWGEHCVECGVPYCYKSCQLYRKRIDRRCKRFANGIERLENYGGLYDCAAKIEFLKWAKLEAIILPNCLNKNKILRQEIFFYRVTKWAKFIANLIPFWLIKRMSYWYKEFVTRCEGKGDNFPDILLIEISNPSDEYNIVIENNISTNTLFRRKIRINKGFNRFCIPFSELNYTVNIRNNLSLIPENETQIMYVHTFDLVKLKKHSSGKKVKCVVWDLDNTLWDGILSEGDEVKLKENIVQYIKDLDTKGVLNSISSKNNYEETYRKLKDFGIADYFLYPQINWGPKSESIKKIADALNIHLDTFMFIDDAEFELAEVAGRLPMVSCYNTNKVDEAMNSEVLDIEISDESKKRRLSYIQIEQRNMAEQVFDGDIDNFLRSCNMVLTVSCPDNNSIARCYELLNRTNQLNISGERLSFDDLQKTILNKNEYLCLQMSCVDKYGDYGIIGFCIINIQNKHKAVLEHFVLSCRAARKKIEQTFFEFLIRYFNKSGYVFFQIKCTKTSRNEMMLTSISGLDYFTKNMINENQFILELPTNKNIDYLNILHVEDKID